VWRSATDGFTLSIELAPGEPHSSWLIVRPEDDGATDDNDLTVISMIVNASIVVKIVLAILALASMLSWTYIFMKMFSIGRAAMDAGRDRTQPSAWSSYGSLKRCVTTEASAVSIPSEKNAAQSDPHTHIGCRLVPTLSQESLRTPQFAFSAVVVASTLFHPLPPNPQRRAAPRRSVSTGGVAMTYGNLTGGDFDGIESRRRLRRERWHHPRYVAARTWLRPHESRARRQRRRFRREHPTWEPRYNFTAASHRLTPYVVARVGRAMASFDESYGGTSDAHGWIYGSVLESLCRSHTPCRPTGLPISRVCRTTMAVATTRFREGI
jgi:hypothetical protein